VFDGFDPAKVARYDKKKVRELLRDAGIIRNRLKIDAAIGNARAFLEVQKEFGTFDAYIWRFVEASQSRTPGKPTNTSPQRRRNLMLSARIFRSEDSGLLDQLFAMR